MQSQESAGRLPFLYVRLHLVKAEASSQQESAALRRYATRPNSVNISFKTNTRCCVDFATVPRFEL